MSGSADPESITIRRFGVDELELVEPLWSTLREHHASVTPGWGPPRPREDSWAIRRASYEGWLADPRSFGLLALDAGGQVVGYSVVQMLKPTATWQFAERAEIETLSVLPSARGQGIGGRLFDAIRTALRDMDVTLLGLEAVVENEGALRFYERQGLRPAIVSLWGEV